MIDFSQNTNPLGPPISVIRFLKQNTNIIAKYPHDIPVSVIDELSSFFRIPSKNIALGLGSTEIFFEIPKILSYRRAVVPVPTFWEYTELNKRRKKEVKVVLLERHKNFKIDYIALNNVLRKNDAVFLCNVNNPTSQLLNKKEIIKLVKKNPSVHFIIDETYLLFREDYSAQTCNSEAIRYKNLHTVTSLSKFFTIPGLRLGALITNKENIVRYNSEIFIPYSINTIIEAVLPILVTDQRFITRSRKYIAKQIKVAFNSFSKKLKGRLELIPPEGNFILGHILTGQDVLKLSKALIRKGVCVRRGDELNNLGKDWIRFAIRSPRENEVLLNKLNKYLKNKKQAKK